MSDNYEKFKVWHGWPKGALTVEDFEKFIETRTPKGRLKFYRVYHDQSQNVSVFIINSRSKWTKDKEWFLCKQIAEIPASHHRSIRLPDTHLLFPADEGYHKRFIFTNFWFAWAHLQAFKASLTP